MYTFICTIILVCFGAMSRCTVTSGSVIRNHVQQAQWTYGMLGIKPCQLCARKMSYELCYCSSSYIYVLLMNSCQYLMTEVFGRFTETQVIKYSSVFTGCSMNCFLNWPQVLKLGIQGDFSVLCYSNLIEVYPSHFSSHRQKRIFSLVFAIRKELRTQHLIKTICFHSEVMRSQNILKKIQPGCLFSSEQREIVSLF